MIEWPNSVGVCNEWLEDKKLPTTYLFGSPAHQWSMLRQAIHQLSWFQPMLWVKAIHFCSEMDSLGYAWALLPSWCMWHSHLPQCPKKRLKRVSRLPFWSYYCHCQTQCECHCQCHSLVSHCVCSTSSSSSSSSTRTHTVSEWHWHSFTFNLHYSTYYCLPLVPVEY